MNKIFLKLSLCTVIFFLCNFVFEAKAQYPYNYTNGCRLSDGRIFATSQRTGRCVYWVTSCDVDNEYYIIRSGGSGATCTPCASGVGNGVAVNFSVYLCPIDDDIFLMLLVMAGIGSFSIIRFKVGNIKSFTFG